MNFLHHTCYSYHTQLFKEKILGSCTLWIIKNQTQNQKEMQSLSVCGSTFTCKFYVNIVALLKCQRWNVLVVNVWVINALQAIILLPCQLKAMSIILLYGSWLQLFLEEKLRLRCKSFTLECKHSTFHKVRAATCSYSLKMWDKAVNTSASALNVSHSPNCRLQFLLSSGSSFSLSLVGPCSALIPSVKDIQSLVFQVKVKNYGSKCSTWASYLCNLDLNANSVHVYIYFVYNMFHQIGQVGFFLGSPVFSHNNNWVVSSEAHVWLYLLFMYIVDFKWRSLL